MANAIGALFFLVEGKKLTMIWGGYNENKQECTLFLLERNCLNQVRGCKSENERKNAKGNMKTLGDNVYLI